MQRCPRTFGSKKYKEVGGGWMLPGLTQDLADDGCD